MSKVWNIFKKGLYLNRRLSHINDENEQNSVSIKKIGHRGAAGYCPENTFASFDRAIQIGVDYIELDVQMSKDGHLVVIHDATVDRTTNQKGRVASYTMKELCSMDAGSWFSQEFQGERIPLFTEVLTKYIDKVGLLIELKKPFLYPYIEEKIASELIRRNLHKSENDQIIIQSFDHFSMKRMKELLPLVPVGVLIKYKGRRLTNRDVKRISTFADYINPKINMISRRLTKCIHHHGSKVFCWTVKKPQQLTKLKKIELDGIITDFPDYFKR